VFVNKKQRGFKEGFVARSLTPLAFYIKRRRE